MGARADFEVTFRHDETGDRLPLVQERELWRIAQEAVTIVERHARATHLRVRWQCDGRSAVLAVADDGPSIPVIMLTMHSDSDVISRAIQAGAVGYLVKDCSTRRWQPPCASPQR